jgi:zinc protease
MMKKPRTKQAFTLAATLILMMATTNSVHGSIARLSSQRLPNGLPVSHYMLPNGLQIYIVENHIAPVFHYQSWFNVGSKDEKLDPNLKITGLAHLFEHMMFRGTTDHGDGEFDRLLTLAGVTDENATTWLDRTNYYQSLPSNALELAVELESDRMANLVIDEETLETEKGAVLGEYRMGLDDPDTIASDTLYATAFVNHPYRYSTIGTEEEIKSFDKAKSDYFYQTYYSPNNAIILIVGDIYPDKAISLIAKHYGGYASQSLPAPASVTEPAQSIQRMAEFKHSQLSQDKLLIGYHVPEARHPDMPALWIAQSMLTLGEASLLELAWVNSGLASGISGTLDQFEDPGLLTLSADLQRDKESSALLGTLDRVLADVPARTTTRSVERAKNQLLLRIYKSWSDNGGLAAYMGEYIASAGDPLFAFTMVERLEAVTVDDVKRVIGRYLRPENRTVVYGRPAGDSLGDGK